MSLPQLWIIGGPNGAGKTTLVQREPLRTLLPNVRALNPDDMTRSLIGSQGYATFATAPDDILQAAFIQAADEVYAEVISRLGRNETVAIESVLSTGKYCPVVENVIGRGGFFGLIYVALGSASLSQERVRNRARLGGHDVDPVKVAARWRRSIYQLPWFVARAHRAYIIDNSDEDPAVPPRLIAESRIGKVTIHEPLAIPELTAVLSTLDS